MVTIISFEKQKTLYAGIQKNPLNIINYFNSIYKWSIKVYKFCIMRVPMVILITTIIKFYAIYFYYQLYFFVNFEENVGWSLIQIEMILNTIFIKLMKEKI